MKNTLITVAALVLTFTCVGCIRGQFAGHQFDHNQVKAVPGANGAMEYRLILPIKGKPYASGAQFIFDQIVAAQAGGDIKSITVDPSTVQVPFSNQEFGEGLFIMEGKVHVVLTAGQEFDAYFREPIEGSCQVDRIFINYYADALVAKTAYREPIASWTAEANDGSPQEVIAAQLSVWLLVKEITADGSVNPSELEDWKSANRIAWSKRSVVGLQ